MNKFYSAIALCGLLLAANLASAQLQACYPVEGGPITITNLGGQVVMTNGVDFASASGGLQFVSAAPYTFPLLQTPNAVTLVVIPGLVDYAPGESKTLGVNYESAGASGDLVAQFGMPGVPTPISNAVVCGFPPPPPILPPSSPIGDFNLDGVVNRLDIDLLGLEIGGGTNHASFDLTSDNLVNQDDLDLFLAGNIITDGNKLNGDADFNGTVAFADFLTFSANFGQDGKKWSEGDFIVDGRVEFDDFLTISANFGKTADSVTLVPEPYAGGMLFVGLSLLGWWRPRRMA